MSIDISKNFSAERCMGSPFRLAVCFSFTVIQCSVTEFPVAQSIIPSVSFTSSAMNKENYSNLPSKAFSRSLQFRITVQVLNLWYYECTNPLQVL